MSFWAAGYAAGDQKVCKSQKFKTNLNISKLFETPTAAQMTINLKQSFISRYFFGYSFNNHSWLTEVTQLSIFVTNREVLVSKLCLKMQYSSETPFRKSSFDSNPQKKLKCETSVIYYFWCVWNRVSFSSAFQNRSFGTSSLRRFRI